MQYTAYSVCYVLAVAAIMIIGLSIYAVKTSADFTGMGGYVIVAILALMCVGLLCMLVEGEIAHKIYAGLAACLFGFLIVYDTQLIFGNAKGSNPKKCQYTIDMYAFAAFELYLDFIQFFIQ